MGIDWNYLADLRVDDLTDESAESLYEQLIQVVFLILFLELKYYESVRIYLKVFFQ